MNSRSAAIRSDLSSATAEAVSNPSDGLLRAAAVLRDSIRRFLNHAGDDVTDHYIRNSALDEWQLAEHETISAHIIKALGSSAWVRVREHAA